MNRVSGGGRWRRGVHLMSGGRINTQPRPPGSGGRNTAEGVSISASASTS